MMIYWNQKHTTKASRKQMTKNARPKLLSFRNSEYALMRYEKEGVLIWVGSFHLGRAAFIGLPFNRWPRFRHLG
jgi:hypothetical protein